MKERLRGAARSVLLVCGIALVAWLVSSVGYRRVGSALYDAGPWLPVVVFMELGIVVTDVIATRCLLGGAARSVRTTTWVRATALAYAAGIVLPAGRAAAEAARATALAADVGLAHAASACSRVQTAALFGTALVSLAAGAATGSSSTTLALLLAGNAVLCAGLAVAVLSIARWKRLTRWLRARWGTRDERPAVAVDRIAVAKASLVCTLGRALQAVQYGVALGAVGGAATTRAALVAQGIHLVGATVGDVVPNQVGATEGAFDMFAAVLGFAREPARALSIALVVRAAQLALAGAAFVVATITFERQARADEPPAAASNRGGHDALDPERHELAGFPIVGGNTDIGVQFGAAATLTRFHDNLTPYLWNVDLMLSASLKSDSTGLRLVQQSHVLRLDAPHLLDDRLRIDVRGSFQRTVDAHYYGIGNATSAAPSNDTTGLGRRYQYLQEEARLRVIARVHTGTPFDLAFGGNVRFVSPQIYAGSKLAEDSAATTNRVRGAETAVLGGIAAGVMVDTRDTEFVTRRGYFYQLGAGYTVGTSGVAAYANTSAILSHYVPIGGPFVFAQRFVASFEVGRVPFYDQQQGGTFEPQNLLGGETGVRGVPQGRYAGLVKTIANMEIRSTLPRFVLFEQRLRFGTTAFFDAGRAWSDYSIDRARDGSKLGLKYGIGGGVFLQWGEAAIFRIEAAYSPDAAAENRGFPVGIYVADGLMF